MIINCKTKTITEVSENKITISCICSENQDGVDNPSIFRSELLKKVTTINKISGEEGNLLLLHTDDNNTVGEIDSEGNLVITLDNDDVDKYQIENQNLTYNE
jgi:hypothetical protein